MAAPPASALIVPVPAAEAVIAPYRRQFDPSAGQGVPAHVTLLYPFLAPDTLDDRALAILAEIAASTEPFSFELRRAERYPGLLVLPPEPDQGFAALRERLIGAWPQIVPYEGRYGLRPPPHVTVAWSDAFKPGGCPDFAPIEADLAPRLPIRDRATELLLEVRRDDRWSVLARFPLSR